MSTTVDKDLQALVARFEEGVSADPTQNMSAEDAAKWKAMNEEHGDKFKTANFQLTHKPLIQNLGTLVEELKRQPFVESANWGTWETDYDAGAKRLNIWRDDTTPAVFATLNVTPTSLPEASQITSWLKTNVRKYNVKRMKVMGKPEAKLNGYWQYHIYVMLTDPKAAKTAGFSIEFDDAWFTFTGNAPFNIDTIRAIGDLNLPFTDVEGDLHDEGDAGIIRVLRNEYSGPLTYTQEKQGLVRENVVHVQFPAGVDPKALLSALQMVGKRFKLKVMPLRSYRKPMTVKKAADPKHEVVALMSAYFDVVARHLNDVVMALGPANLKAVKALQINMVHATAEMSSDVRAEAQGGVGTQFQNGKGRILRNPPKMSLATANWWWDQTDAVQFTLARQVLTAKATALGVTVDPKQMIRASDTLDHLAALDMELTASTLPGVGLDKDAAALDELAKLAALDVVADSMIGKTILEQMGGARRLQVMLGVQQIILLPDGVGIKWPSKQPSKGNYVEIRLNGSDLYDVAFYNVGRGSKKLVKMYDDLYADNLVGTFERQTGWYLRMASEQAHQLVRVSGARGPDPRGHGWEKKENPTRWNWSDRGSNVHFTVSETVGPGMMIYTLRVLTDNGMFKHSKPAQWKTPEEAFKVAAKWFPIFAGEEGWIGDMIHDWAKVGAARNATEFDSEEALKKYLHDHPGADPKNHTVKKKDDGGGSEKKDEGGSKPVSMSREGYKAVAEALEGFNGPGAWGHVISYAIAGKPMDAKHVNSVVKDLDFKLKNWKTVSESEGLTPKDKKNLTRAKGILENWSKESEGTGKTAGSDKQAAHVYLVGLNHNKEPMVDGHFDPVLMGMILTKITGKKVQEADPRKSLLDDSHASTKTVSFGGILTTWDKAFKAALIEHEALFTPVGHGAYRVNLNVGSIYEKSAEGEDSKEGKFEEGVSADPTKNMSPEDAAEWKKQNEANKDNFKSARLTSRAELEDIGREAEGCPDNLDESECKEWEANTEKYQDKFKAAGLTTHLANPEKKGFALCGERIDPKTTVTDYAKATCHYCVTAFKKDIDKKAAGHKTYEDYVSDWKKLPYPVNVKGELLPKDRWEKLMDKKATDLMAEGCPDNLDESECVEWEANTEKYKDVVKDQNKTATAKQLSWADGDKSAPWTPWGPAQHAYEIARGVRQYSTSSHGGLAIAQGAARGMLTPAAVKSGLLAKGYYWYEEDDMALIPYYEHPEWMNATGGGYPLQALEADVKRSHPKYFAMREQGVQLAPKLKAGMTLKVLKPLAFHSGASMHPGLLVKVEKVMGSNMVVSFDGNMFKIPMSYYMGDDAYLASAEGGRTAYEEGSRVPDGWDNGHIEGEKPTDGPDEGSDVPDGSGNSHKRAGTDLHHLLLNMIARWAAKHGGVVEDDFGVSFPDLKGHIGHWDGPLDVIFNARRKHPHDGEMVFTVDMGDLRLITVNSGPDDSEVGVQRAFDRFQSAVEKSLWGMLTRYAAQHPPRQASTQKQAGKKPSAADKAKAEKLFKKWRTEASSPGEQDDLDESWQNFLDGDLTLKDLEDNPPTKEASTKQSGEAIEEMYALVSDDGYMLGATDDWHDARSKSYWRYAIDEDHLAEGKLMTLVNVPLRMAERFKDMGTSAQMFSDGSAAWDSARKYVKGPGTKLATEKEAASGLYGHTRRIQSDCESCVRKVQKTAARIAKDAYGKHEKVAEFLSVHAKRADSLPAKILVAALREIGPRVATQMRLANLRFDRRVTTGEYQASLSEQVKNARALAVGPIARDLWEKIGDTEVSLKDVVPQGSHFARVLEAAEGLKIAGLATFDGIKIAKVTDADAQTGEGIKQTTDKSASGSANAKYLNSISPAERSKILKSVAKHYGVSVSEIEDELKDGDAEPLYEYIGNDGALQKQVHRDFQNMRLASDRKAAQSYGLYGYGEKVASLGLQACTDLRHQAGRIAYDLHSRRNAHHGAINDFFANHSKQAKCMYSKLLSASYPEMGKTANMGSTYVMTGRTFQNKDLIRDIFGSALTWDAGMKRWLGYGGGNGMDRHVWRLRRSGIQVVEVPGVRLDPGEPIPSPKGTSYENMTPAEQARIDRSEDARERYKNNMARDAMPNTVAAWLEREV